MSALAALGRALVALVAITAYAAWILLAACLAVVYGAPILDALTGGLTP